jgi:hypothetical protein
MEVEQPFRRTSGLSRPLNVYQITTWVFLIVFPLIFYALYVPAVTPRWQPAAGIVFGAFYIVLVG